MKYAFPAAALIALAACGDMSVPSNNLANGADAATANEVAPAANAADVVANAAVVTPAAGAAPTPEFMVGRWGEEGDCTLAIDFRADGTMDGPFERWSLDGDRLTMEGNPQVSTLSVVDQNTMESRLEGGPPRRLTRC